MVDRLEPETKKAKLESNLTADGASAGEPSSLMQEFWQSFKYSTVQQPYNGISQAVNYFGGNMPERKLVEAPQPRDFGSSEWMAQTAGGGISKLAGIMLLHKGISSVPGLGAGARSLTMTESTAMGRMSLGSLSVAGGLYEGLVTTSGDNFWRDRLTNAGIGSLAMYTMGRTQMGLQNLTGLAKYAPETMTGILGRQLGNSATGVLAGSASGFVTAEGSSFLKTSKPASGQALTETMLTNAVLGGAFGLTTRPTLKQGELYTRRTGALEAVPENTPVARSVQPNAESGMPQFAKLAGEGTVVPQKPMKLTSVGLDELLKPPRIDSRIKTTPLPPAEPPVQSTKLSPDLPPGNIPDRDS